MNTPLDSVLAEAIDRPHARMRPWLRVLVRLTPAFATMLLAVALLAAMYLTDLDWQWVTFLAGVLFAALLSLVGRASHAEWVIARRTAQVARLNNRLAQEGVLLDQAKARGEGVDERLHFMADALPQMLCYITADERIELSNRAFRESFGLRDAHPDSNKLADVLGPGTYAEIQPRVARALNGQRVVFEYARVSPLGELVQTRVEYIPHRNGEKVVGILALIGQAAAAREPVREVPRAPAPVEVPVESSQALYVDALNQQLTGWADPHARLRQAFERNEFRLFAQHVMPLGNGDRHFYEIYVRLQEEEDSLAAPGAFIPLVEHLGMTEELDKWVISNVIEWHRKACLQGAGWNDATYGVSLFSETVRDPQFAGFVQAVLARADVPPAVLCFSVPEEEAADASSPALRLASELTRIGCRIALSGFGDGHVSFGILNRMTVNYLKVDASVIREIDTSPVHLAKLKAIARVCRTIGVRTVAQFVENTRVLPRLRELGFDYVHGYGIALPRPVATILNAEDLKPAVRRLQA